MVACFCSFVCFMQDGEAGLRFQFLIWLMWYVYEVLGGSIFVAVEFLKLGSI